MAKDDEINNILDMQQKIYRDAVTLLFSSVTQRVDDQCKMLQDLRSSLEFSQSEISCLKEDLTTAKKQIEDSQNIIVDQSKTIIALQTKVDKLESYSRRKNIRIDGLVELNNENYQQTHQKVDKLLKEKLQLHDIKVEVAHRLPKSNLVPGSQPRTIIAKLTSTAEKDATMKNKHKLKGSGIYVNEDLSEGVMKTRQEKLPELQAARNAGKIAYFRRDRLIVKERMPDRLREPASTSAPQNEPRTPPPSNVSTLIQAFTPLADNEAATAARPPDLGNTEVSMEKNQSEKNDDKNCKPKQQRKSERKK